MTLHDKLFLLQVKKREQIPQKVEWGFHRLFRVEGTATNEFSRTGKTLPFSKQTTYPVVAFEVLCDTGETLRFLHRYEAIEFITVKNRLKCLLNRSRAV